MEELIMRIRNLSATATPQQRVAYNKVIMLLETYNEGFKKAASGAANTGSGKAEDLHNHSVSSVDDINKNVKPSERPIAWIHCDLLNDYNCVLDAKTNDPVNSLSLLSCIIQYYIQAGFRSDLVTYAVDLGIHGGIVK